MHIANYWQQADKNMKDAINKYLRRFGIEIHGVGYIQKLKNADLKKSEWNKQQELLKSKADVIFDVGANRGDITLKYLNLFQLKVQLFLHYHLLFLLLQTLLF